MAPKVPDQPYVLPHRPKSDPRAAVLAIVAVVAAVVGLPGETAGKLAEDAETAVNLVVGAIAAVGAVVAFARTMYHRHIQRVQLTVAAPTAFMADDPTNPTDVRTPGGES